MPMTLGRNLHLCFTKIKSPLALQSESTPLASDGENRPSAAATAATTTTSILIKNFNSLYDHTTTNSLNQHTPSTISDSDDCDAETAAAATPDFATIYASQRFFVSSPGRSNSIIDSSLSPSSSLSSETDLLKINTTVTDSVAVPTFSPNPYMDFRRSMQEMVEARGLMDVKSNWEYLHELLLCYLALNPKSTHKFILRAFADLIVSLM